MGGYLQIITQSSYATRNDRKILYKVCCKGKTKQNTILVLEIEWGEKTEIEHQRPCSN